MTEYTVTATLDEEFYSYQISLSPDELVLSYTEPGCEKMHQISFGSVEELRKVADMMISLAKVYEPS